jgi:hypothetical protein
VPEARDEAEKSGHQLSLVQFSLAARITDNDVFI